MSKTATEFTTNMTLEGGQYHLMPTLAMRIVASSEWLAENPGLGIDDCPDCDRTVELAAAIQVYSPGIQTKVIHYAMKKLASMPMQTFLDEIVKGLSAAPVLVPVTQKDVMEAPTMGAVRKMLTRE